MKIELHGIAVEQNGKEVPRYCLHWDAKGSHVDAQCYFGLLPSMCTGDMPCITRVPTRGKGQRHAMKCACGKHEIVRPE